MSTSFPNEKSFPFSSSSIIPLHDGGRNNGQSQNARKSKSFFHKLTSAVLVALIWLSLYRLTTTYLARDTVLFSPSPSPSSMLPSLDSIDIQSLPLGEITWHACPAHVDTSGLFDCGHLSAPLDHLDQSTPLAEQRKAAIYIIRYKARQSHGGELSPREEVQGTIIMNPGGPGGSGVDFLTKRTPKQGNVTRAELFDRMLHGKYDFLSFDPRGVGLTWPRANCWKDAADSCLNSVVTSTQGLYHSVKGGEKAQAGMKLAQFDLVGDLCADNTETNDTLRYVGTTAVARDMRLMYSAVGDEGLNYWGFSYGTVLGSTFADMFPDEVRRVIIDGTVNVTDYYLSRWASTMVNTDEVFYGFIRECAAAGSACALTKDLDHKKLGKKALEHKVLAKVADLFDELAVKPISASRAKHPGLLTWSQLKGTIFQALYAPTAWNDLAKDLQALVEGDPVPFFEKHGLAPCENVPPTKPQSDEAMLAIACGDVGHVYKKKPTIKEFTQLIEEEERLSKYFGGSFSETAACRGEWKIHSNEPYTGDFTSKTKHGLLIIGNSYDPVTPHVNAEYMSSLFPNSAYLLRKGYGHCSISQKSTCNEKTVSDYFLDGTLPKNGTVCDVDTQDEPLFYEGAQVQDVNELNIASLLNEHGAAGRFLMSGMEDLAAINSRPHRAF